MRLAISNSLTNFSHSQACWAKESKATDSGDPRVLARHSSPLPSPPCPSSPSLALFLSPVSCRLPLLPAPRLLLLLPSCLKGSPYFCAQILCLLLALNFTVRIIFKCPVKCKEPAKILLCAPVKIHLLVVDSSTRVPHAIHNLNVLELSTGFFRLLSSLIIREKNKSLKKALFL